MDTYQLNNQQQEQIYRRLNSLVGPGAAAFYHDACRLMEMEPLLKSTTHLVGHLLREIESSLRDVLMPISKPLAQGTSKEASGDEKHKAEIKLVLTLLEIPETFAVAQTWLSLPGKDNEYGLHKRAHRKALERPRPVDSEFQEFWHKMQVVLDGVLDRFEAKYSAVCHLLDKLLNKTHPDKKDIDGLRNKIPNSFVTLNYFFEHLSLSGCWLNKLREEGFFKSPPEPKFDPDTEKIFFEQWPQSRYLTRMATQAPAIVLDIVIEILKTGTKNVLVHEDLAEAALAMPPELAARWVEQEIEWLKEQGYLYFQLPEKLGKLIAYLAEKTQVSTALKLAYELLTILPSFQSNNLILGISIRCDSYHYQKILTEYIPKLVAAAGNETLQLLCYWLNEAVRFSKIPRQPGTFEDDSYNWYPTFDGEQHNRLHDVKGLLATAVWKTTEQLARNAPAQVASLLQMLESYHWRIFYRIRLNLLRHFPDKALDLIAQRLVDRSRLNEPILYCHEYALLLRERFADSGSEVQETILSWIVEGPTDKGQVNEDERNTYIKQWQRDRLGILNGSLPIKWQLQYEQLVKELGFPEPLESVSGSSVWEGPTSPKSTEELVSMTTAELFAFLREWQPSGSLFAPSRRGLARDFSKVIAQNPEVFVSESEQFKELSLEYWGGFFKGLNQALATHVQRLAFSWSQPLEFCYWILTQQSEMLGSIDPGTDWHEDWNWLCDAVVTLIDSGLQPIGANEIPLELRSLVWTILKPLTDDPLFTPGFESRYLYSNARPSEASVDTVRGKAMQAIFGYALWVQRHTNTDESQEDQVAWDFDDIPEVREVLERHLDPTHAPSHTIWSVYGKSLPYLMDLDSNWTTQNLNRIFPRDEVFQELRDAAWKGYVTSSDSELFTILREEYNHAVERIGAATSEGQNQSSVDKALVTHLVDLYWRGELEQDSPDRLLERFFAKASAQQREEFMGQIGQRLLYRNIEIGADLLRRLTSLWEWRVSQIKSVIATNSQASDLKTFSWWFISEKFDFNWAITQLNDVFRLAKDVKYDSELLRKLVALAPSMPLSIVECLGLMAADDFQSFDWFNSYYKEASRTILFTAIKSGNEEAGKAAKELINRLLARNYADYRDLILDKDA